MWLRSWGYFMFCVQVRLVSFEINLRARVSWAANTGNNDGRTRYDGRVIQRQWICAPLPQSWEHFFHSETRANFFCGFEGQLTAAASCFRLKRTLTGFAARSSTENRCLLELGKTDEDDLRVEILAIQLPAKISLLKTFRKNLAFSENTLVKTEGFPIWWWWYHKTVYIIWCHKRASSGSKRVKHSGSRTGIKREKSLLSASGLTWSKETD